VLKKKKKRRITADYSTTTALLPVTDNERRLAAELARDSLVALVPCKEMARGSGALGSCTGVARDSLVALGSAAVRTDGLATEQAVLWFFARKRREKAVLSGARNTSTKTCFWKKWTSGYNWIYFVCCYYCSCVFYSYPDGPLLYLY